jgi:hypothetical protein
MHINQLSIQLELMTQVGTFFYMLYIHSSQDLSIAHDFLDQVAQEKHAYKKKYFIKIVIKGNRYFFGNPTFIQEKDVGSRKRLKLKTVVFYINFFFSYVYELRRLQDLFIAHDFLAQKVYGHQTTKVHSEI